MPGTSRPVAQVILDRRYTQVSFFRRAKQRNDNLRLFDRLYRAGFLRNSPRKSLIDVPAAIGPLAVACECGLGRQQAGLHSKTLSALQERKYWQARYG